MPIDIKWIRSNPEVVEEWQRTRGRSVEVVQEVVQLDEAALAKLQSLQQLKRALAALQRQLRPGKEEGRSREELLQEKKALEDEIGSETKLWKEAVRRTERALWKVASAVDVLENGAAIIAPSAQMALTSLPPLPSIDADAVLSQTGMQLQHAFQRYVIEFFGMYPGVQLSGGGLRVTTTQDRDPCSLMGTVDADTAHALWGCSGVDDDASPCSICQVGIDDSQQATLLPTWLQLLTEFTPPKSILGDKQLPVYTACWGDGGDNDAALQTSFSLDLVALTASSMVDARQVQQQMMEHLTVFYKPLMMDCQVKTRRMPPSKLALHECSRIEVLVDVSGTICCLGAASIWGDAASRACNMTFAGGGVRGMHKHSSQNIKDYVYIVQASVVDADTWQMTLFSNLKDAADSERRVSVPSVLKPHFCHPDDLFKNDDNGNIFVEWRDLFVSPCSKAKKKDVVVFGPLRKSSFTQVEKDAAVMPIEQGKKLSGPKFPLLDLKAKVDAKKEALSCPFEFLTHQLIN